MSFIYSRALVEAFLEDNSSGIHASVPSSGSPSPKPFLWHGKTIKPSRLSRFGIMCKPLTASRGKELLTWWRADFLAKTYQSPAKEKGFLANDLECGLKCSELFAKYNPDTASLKTVQCSLPGVSTGSSLTLPEQGSMRGGLCYRHETLVPRILGNVCGFSHLTPTASEGAFGKTLSGGIYHLTIHGKVVRESRSGVMFQQMLSSQEKLKPQILAHIKKKKQMVAPPAFSKKSGLFKVKGKSAGQYHVPGLSVAVVASVDSKFLTRNGLMNPEWSEWLMGWTIGQTALKPLATGRYQEWLQQHSFS